MTPSIRRNLLRAAEELGHICYARQLAAAKHVRRVNGVPNVRYVPPAIQEMLVQALRDDWGDDRAMALLHTRDYEIMRYGDGKTGVG
jgi:hypothetical protein